VLFTDKPDVAVALVYQSQALHQHLRSALDEFGAHVVYESTTSGFLQSALDQSGASVVLINLDPAIDEEIAQIENLLFDNSRKVIFNDGEVTSKLSGWDLARWARHLAAKIMGDTQLLPARPAGAEAVPVRDMPQHALDSTFKPAALQPPVVSGEAEDRAAREINAALASFSLETGAASVQTQARDELEAALNDFGFFSETAASTSVNAMPFDTIAQPDPVPVAAPVTAAPAKTADAPLLADSAEELFADFDFSSAPAAAPKDDTEVTELTDDGAFADIQFDFDDATAASTAKDVPQGLDEFLSQHSYKPQDVTVELPVPASIPTATKRPAIDVDRLMSGLSFELSPVEDERREPEAVPAAAAAPTTAKRDELASAFDDVLSSLSLAPMEDDTVAAPAPGSTTAAKTVSGDSAEDPFANLALELEPVSAPDDASSADDNPFANLNFSLDAEPATATTPAAIAAKIAANTKSGNQSYAQPAPEMSGGFSRVWVLGASIGGPDAVREFLSGIPKSTSNVFLLAQHMGADFIDLMVSQLAKATSLEVKMAASGVAAKAGQVLVVPLAERMLLGTDGDVRIVPLDEASPYSPSIDQVLFDVADRFGARAGAIIFSGMAHDAIEGAKHLAAKGGVVWAQDPATCVVSSMIDGAVEAGIVRYQGSPSDLAQRFSAEFA
jgi:chemosensory pili system protein ChpB (putative protein-glutamate methylesterase)